MERKFSLLVILFIFIAMLGGSAELAGSAEGNDEKTILYFFYSQSCPHCAAEKPFLEELERRYPELEVRYLKASKNRKLFEEMAKEYGTSASGVPRTFIGDKVFIGFREDDCDLIYLQGYNGFIGCPNQIENSVRECLNLSCKLPKDNAIHISQQDPTVREFLQKNPNSIATILERGSTYMVGWWTPDRIRSDIEYPNLIVKIDANSGSILKVEIPESNEYGFVKPDLGKINLVWMIFLFLILVYLVSYLLFKKRAKFEERYWLIGFVLLVVIGLFALAIATPEGDIEKLAKKYPFPGFVFVVALADGFNPCAFTVLIVLLSLLTHTKSRKKMMLIGSIFILTSAFMYFLFIMVILTAGSWIFSQYGDILFRLIGLLVLGVGIINLKDFFFFKKGISLGIPEEKRKEIFGKAGKIVRGVELAEDRRTLILAVMGTAGLAALVNLVELGCTAMFPMVYMASLFETFGDTISVMHTLYTAFYSIVYVIPLFAILGSFVYSFKSERLSEGKARILKLVSGLLMLCFGLVMILKPELLVFG